MRGAAMSLTAAASGFVVLLVLLTVSVVQSQNDWGVTYTYTQFCAVKGSTVNILCSYRYPSTINNVTTTVQQRFWFIENNNYSEPVDLTTDPNYTGRVEYGCHENDCTLRIRDLRESDSAEYKFRFITNQEKGSFHGSPGVSLTVVQPQNKWGVTYNSTKICAVKGSTVNIRCSYRYPSTINNIHTAFQNRFWFIKNNNSKNHVDLTTDPDYTGRVEYSFNENDCTLIIRNLRESDSAEYNFRFKTNQQCRSFTGFPGVTLTVTDLQVKVRRSSTQTELQCHSSCDVADPPSYVWYQNGQKMEEETSSLRVSVRDDDSSYSCAVKGCEDYRSAPVYAPKVVSVSGNPTGDIKERDSVTLTCNSDANPAPTYTWYKINGRVRPRNEQRLFFRSIQPSDSGQYYCSASNNVGSSTSGYISIVVKYAPKAVTVSVSPSAEIVQGSSVTLTCSSDANPTADYTWYKEDDQTRLSEEPQLSFRSIQPSDSGLYYCTASNNVGSSGSGYIRIAVKYAPKLPSVSVSPSGGIKEGSSVTLTCSSDANPAATYSWFKNNDQTPLSKQQQLFFRAIRSSDSGQYHCRAENKLGRKTSEFIAIDVKYAPKVVTVSGNPTGDIEEGRSVTLTCNSHANPAASYVWYKENGQTPLSEEPQLSFRSIHPSDSGQYYCIASNNVGSSASGYIRIAVKYAPKVVTVSGNPTGDIKEGRSVTLTCNSNANPAPTYTWYKINGRVRLRNEQRLSFWSIQSSDSGQYYCIAENEVGRMNSSSIFINVTYAPKLPSVSVSPSAEIVEGSSVTLTCSSDANPAADYTWYKENDDSAKASGQNFTITDIRSEHSGSYYCVAQNNRGRHNSTVQLTVVSKAWKLMVAATVPAILLALILISVVLRIIKNRSSKQQPESGERPETTEQHLQLQPAEDDVAYSSVHFSKHTADSVYSNIRPSQVKRHKEEKKEEAEMVEYAAVTFKSASTAPRIQTMSEEAAEDPAALYSTVNKPLRRGKRNL